MRLRTVGSAALAAVLLVLSPSAAQATTTRAKVSTQLNAAFASDVAYGSPATLRGTLKPAAAHTITLERFVSRAWRVQARTTSSRTGAFSFRITPTAVGAFTYRARYAGNSTTTPAVSPTRVLHVSAAATALHAALTTSSVRTSVPDPVTGTLSPALSGQSVALQVSTTGAWRTISTRTTDGKGRFTFAFIPISVGTDRLRVVHAATADTHASTSATMPLTVLAALGLTSSGLLAGNVDPDLPVGTPGQLSVVEQGQLDTSSDFNSMPVVLRNNTAHTISDISVVATTHSSAGQVVTGNGDSYDMFPTALPPGGVALSLILFKKSSEVPAGAQFAFDFSSIAYDPDPTLKVTLTATSDQTLAGTAENVIDATMSGPYDVGVFCFADDRLSGWYSSVGDDTDDLAPGASVSFTAYRNVDMCDSYLVGANGYHF